jgi:hypothetical protein
MKTASQQLIALSQEAIRRCELDLSGLTLLTEAASGAYAVTPILAAMSGARRVFALARDSRYGRIAAVTAGLTELARSANVEERIRIVIEKNREIVAEADIITNSGHLRPIDREMIAWMKPGAVIPLMYEAWELREADIDVAACAERGIAVAGSNERHPAVDVFSFLGRLAERLLAEAGVASRGKRIVVLCDNQFREFITDHLTNAGAMVEAIEKLDENRTARTSDVILVAMTPRAHPSVGRREAEIIAHRYRGALVAQLWGDIDRDALTRCGVRFWPIEPPPRGHQGIMLSSLGPEPVVRLQAGGLKVGEVMARARIASPGKESCDRAIAAAIASGFGQAVTSATRQLC